jgi:hypothetical protein
MELFSHAPKVTGHYEFVLDKDEPPVITYYQLMEEHLPREFMDEILAVRGDGTGRISFSTDFGIKEFGTGAAGSCNLSISCGGDSVNIARAADIGSRWSIHFTKMHYERAEAEMRQMLAARGKQVT